jgi:LemA protein
MQHQQLETEAQKRGYTSEEYREVVRRAQRIRADKDERLSREELAASAAEVGIREEDLRAAEQQIEQERALQAEARVAQAQTRRTQLIAAAVVAVILALTLLFSYSSLSAGRLGAEQARANLQSTLQRRADVIPQLVPLVRESAANEQKLVGEINSVAERLRSGDVNTQLDANEAFRSLLLKAGDNSGFRSSDAYRDLMAEIAGSENRINVARTRYNAAVTAYNSTAQSFPTGLVRPLLGFPGSMPLFEAKGKNLEQPPVIPAR